MGRAQKGLYAPAGEWPPGAHSRCLPFILMDFESDGQLLGGPAKNMQRIAGSSSATKENFSPLRSNESKIAWFRMTLAAPLPDR